MNTHQFSIMPDIEEPEPISHVVVKRTDPTERIIKFDATPPAIEAIRARRLGIVNEREDSGWCVLVVNKCYRFESIEAWMRKLQSPEVEIEYGNLAYDEMEPVA